MNSLRIEVLTDHQFSEDGLSCMCGGVFYTFAPPYKETLRSQAVHQLTEMARVVPMHSHSRTGEWDD